MTVSAQFLEEQRLKRLLESARAAPLNPWSEARNRMLTQPGHLYAAYSSGKCWIKVGFSLNVPRRMGEINRRFPALAPFTLIGATPSVYSAERQMHRILSRFRFHAIGLSRELYLALPVVEKLVQTVVEGVDRPRLTLDEYIATSRWASECARKPRLREIVHDFYTVGYRTGFREVA